MITEEFEVVFYNVCFFSQNEFAFTKGFTKHSHIYKRIADHEASKSHEAPFSALFNAKALLKQSNNDGQ